MRVMVFVKASKESEAGVMPNQKMLAEMAAFNEELVNAGVLQDGGGLHPSRKAKRINYEAGRPTVVDGPFAEAKELVAGFWVFKVSSLDEAVQWLKKAPFDTAQVELRPFFEAEDFGAELTPELRSKNERIFKESEKNK